MTNAIPLDPIEPRRDRLGRYMARPPGADETTAYTRVTTVAKTFDDGGGLGPWLATMAIGGLLARPGLRAQWEALRAEHGPNPWYASADAKAACKKLVAECQSAGGSSDRAEVGTALHAMTARSDLGHALGPVGDETARDLEAYRTGLAATGVEILAGMVELSVVLDRERIAGTFDRLVMVPGHAKPVVGDLKTGASLSYSWPSIAVQLAAYAHADAIYTFGAASDGSLDQRTPMPEVDQEVGAVLWLPAGEARLSVFLVDLEAGWDAFGHALWARQWRRAQVARALTAPPAKTPKATPDAELLPALERSVAMAARQKEVLAERAWLQDRVNVIGDHSAARFDLQRSWPEGLPTLRQSTDHSVGQLDEIARLLSLVERAHRLPFPPDRPADLAHDTEAQVLQLFPGSATTQGGQRP